MFSYSAFPCFLSLGFFPSCDHGHLRNEIRFSYTIVRAWNYHPLFIRNGRFINKKTILTEYTCKQYAILGHWICQIIEIFKIIKPEIALPCCCWRHKKNSPTLQLLLRPLLLLLLYCRSSKSFSSKWILSGCCHCHNKGIILGRRMEWGVAWDKKKKN